jgi:glycosyltransferase involved in cell wall biosynthesis
MPSASETPSRPAALTVVVLGYRNAATIVAAVRSVLTQVAADPFEVVVVTSGGDDSADRVRAAFPHAAVYDSPSRLLPGQARNAGIARTTAPIVSFLAADCEARPGWISARLCQHRAGHRAVASGMANAGPRRPAALADLYLLYASRLPGRGAGLVTWPDPAVHGLSFERGLLDELGRFDEDVRIGEDTIVAKRLAEMGVGIWFDPGVQIAHRGPATLVELVTDEYRRGWRLARFVASPPHLHGSLRWVLREELRLVAGAVTAAFRQAWVNAPRERRALVLCTPWMLAGAAARRLGRVRGVRLQG